jgi:hypothetical protein
MAREVPLSRDSGGFSAVPLCDSLREEQKLLGPQQYGWLLRDSAGMFG